MNGLKIQNYLLLGFLLFSSLISSCDVIDTGIEERVPGLCVNRVNTCPSEVLPAGEYGGAIISSFDMPIYPHPDCRAIHPNDRTERRECTRNRILEYLDENIVYPKAAIDNAIEGSVNVTIIVSFPHACISSIEVSGDLGYGTVCELQRVLTLMPSFERTEGSTHAAHYMYRFRYEFNL